MEKTVLDRTSAYIGESARKASQVSSTVANAVEDGLDVAKRAVKEGRDAVEDFVDGTTKRVKRHPIESVILSLAVGVAVGFVIGWAVKDA
jgi:ElaB/YqjD/DUF883 family membrane-anchored ribosome-binding protein